MIDSHLVYYLINQRKIRNLMNVKTSTLKSMILNEVETLSEELMVPAFRAISSLKGESVNLIQAAQDLLIPESPLFPATASNCKLADLWNRPEEDLAWAHL